MRIPSLVLLLPLASLVACRSGNAASGGVLCDGVAARVASQTGTLTMISGDSTRFYLRVNDRDIRILVDRPDRVSTNVLQGLSARSVRVDGRESPSAARICADAVTGLETTGNGERDVGPLPSP